MHLQHHWSELKRLHAISKLRICYHGVRFTTGTGDDDMSVIAGDWGVHTHILPNYDSLPAFLFRICQVAREKRSKSP